MNIKDYPNKWWIYKGKPRTFRSMIRYAKRYNRPVDNWFAEMIWRLFSGNVFNIEFSKKMYLSMGYKAFEGFPLIRNN